MTNVSKEILIGISAFWVTAAAAAPVTLGMLYLLHGTIYIQDALTMSLWIGVYFIVILALYFVIVRKAMEFWGHST